jgi:microcystin-dependent protein
MSEPYIGQIMMFAGNFEIRGWAMCNGQLLSIAQNTALFSILGTTYGGNGQTTFALPDLRGRAPIHFGQGPGLSPYDNHIINASANNGNDSFPANAFPASAVIPTQSNTSVSSYNTASDGTTMNPAVVGAAGGSQPHENRSPFLTINFLIALEGIYPSRS